ncbi:MAG TPA: single-stranded-DNA-specific exonuclease C-terminal domain-containing protein, partial [Bacillales bacterium]|nr:single-stranded-DNA-specific exonuclease C-terminal domain-containing protein [Bacillales bacterium]
DSWQLFDFRGSKQIGNIHEMVPVENRKCILFNQDTFEKLNPELKNEAIFIQTSQEAKDLDLSAANVALVDLPPSKEMLQHLFLGKKPARIYAYFYKESSDFFSTMPTRDHFKWFYALLLKKGPIDLNRYGESIANSRGWSKETIFFLSQVFSELDFVTIDNGFITLKRQALKRDLTDSRTYQIKLDQYNLESDLLLSSFQQLKKWFDCCLEESVEIEEAIE